MEKTTKEIIIELRVHLAEELYHDFFASKEEAVHLYLDSSNAKTKVFSEDGELNEVKLEAKRLMTKDLSEAIEFLKRHLLSSCNEFDDLISLSSKFNRASEFLHQGVIDFQTAEQEFVRIGNAMLQILKGLSIEHLKK